MLVLEGDGALPVTRQEVYELGPTTPVLARDSKTGALRIGGMKELDGLLDSREWEYFILSTV